MSRRMQVENGSVSSVLQAASVCGVSAPVVRRWLTLGLLSEPPWTLQQLREVRDIVDPNSRRRGSQAGHGTSTRWNMGCSCAQCGEAKADATRARKRAKAQARIPIELRKQLLSAIYAGQPFRPILRDLGLTPNAVWGLAKTDEEWSEALEAALMATRRDDLSHGTNAAYVAGCICKDCREHQRIRMAGGHIRPG